MFRGNRVDSNGGIVVRGSSANVLVEGPILTLNLTLILILTLSQPIVLMEGSVVARSDVGVHVNYTTTQGGIVLRDNSQPPHVPANFDPYA